MTRVRIHSAGEAIWIDLNLYEIEIMAAWSMVPGQPFLRLKVCAVMGEHNESPPKYPLSTPPQVAELIDVLDAEYMSVSEMMVLMNLRDRKSFRENFVSPALKDEAIERMYPSKPNHPRQKYRLTEKVLRWKREREKGF